MLRRILVLLLSCLFWRDTVTDSQIQNIVSPKLDFTTNQLGSISITYHWQAFFQPNSILPNLKARIVFPFALTNPLAIDWVQINDACTVSTNMISTTSYASTIIGDATGAHFFDMVDANYFSGAKYKMIVRITMTADIPTSLGNTDPIKFEIVADKLQDYIIYAYNYNFGYIRISSPAVGNFEFDLTPSYTDPNLQEFTRDFAALADVRITDLKASRILLKMDNYQFTDDAESTCNTIASVQLGIEMLDRTTFFCEFENTKKQGLYFIWKDGYYPPLEKTVRLKFRVQNPSKPGSTSMTVSMYDRYSPKVLKFKTLSNAFSCGPTSFGTLYPVMFLGPNLDTTSQFFPNVTLFTKGNKANTIIYNSIRLEFQVSLDLPVPGVSYTVKVRIGGTAQTSIPLSLIYHDLPTALGFATVKISVDALNTNIIFENVADLSSRSVYTIGFKVGFFGDETLVFLGDTSFGAIEVLDAAQTYSVVKRKAPPGVKDTFKVQPVASNMLAGSPNLLTHMHSRPISSAVAYTYAALASPNYGLQAGASQNLFLSLQTSGITFGTTPVDNQAYIEVIASKHVQATPAANDNWLNANAWTNCFAATNAGANLPAANLASCRYDYLNLGLYGAEYTRYRMGGGTTSALFFTNGAMFAWRNANISKMSSLMTEGSEAAVLDFYVKIYSNSYTTDISTYFPVGLEYTLLINGYVFDSTQFTGTNLFFINFNSVVPMDGTKVPTLLRVSGLLTNANTFKTKKLVLFFKQITAHPLDPDLPYEVGCNTAATASVKCYYYKGFDSVSCAAGTCTNYVSQNRLEILMSTTISSIADIYQLHIVVPVLIPAGISNNIPIIIGTAAQYSGSLSAFPDMLATNQFLPTFSACTSCPGAAVTPFTGVQVNAGTATVMNVAVTSMMATVGSTYSPQLAYNCPGGSNAWCKVNTPGSQFFSVSLCSTSNFMAAGSFAVNYLTDTFERCVPNLVYATGTGVSRVTRYCLYCPQWTDGTTSSTVQLADFTAPNNKGLKVPPNTWSALSGLQSTVAGTTYGLRSLSELSLTTADVYVPATINNIVVSPSTIFYDATSTPTTEMSLKLDYTMTLTNPIPKDGFVTFIAGANLVFDFMTTPTSTYCQIVQLSLACTVTRVGPMEFYIKLTQEIPAGTITISLYGLKAVFGGSIPVVSSITIFTTNSNGRTNTDRIDTASLPVDVTLDQYLVAAVPAPLNVLKLSLLTLEERVVNYRTELAIDVVLGNNKKFLACDKLTINLNDGAYQPSDILNIQPVYCEIVDATTGLLIPEFSTCTVSDLATINVKAASNTNQNTFRIKILNYIVKALGPAAIIPTGVLTLAVAPGTTLQSQTLGDTSPAWPTDLAAATTITNVAITKSVSYFGLRPEFTFSITPASTSIGYETRVYIQFPAPYNAGFGSFPVSCYQDASPPAKLYCWRLRDRTLAVTGFRTTVAAGSELKLKVYGVQQPLHALTEQFYVGIDADADPGRLNEVRAVSILAAPLSTANLIPRTEVQSTLYSHHYIRAANSLLVKILNTVLIPSGSFVYIYIDYLSYEYDIADYTAICSIKLSQGGVNLVSTCVREGNRYKLTTSAALTANLDYTVLIENIPTPDFYGCNVKLPEMFILDSSNNLLAISTDIMQNTDSVSFINDDKFTYFTFDGLDASTPLSFKKGIFNEVKVKRMDGNRMNDDFIFNLSSTENGIFSQLDPASIKVYHNHFGLANIPVYLASTINTFINVIPVTLNFTARFNPKKFAKLPILRAQMVTTKTTLITPASVVVWTSKGSLGFYVYLREMPIEDVAFSVAFTGTTSLTCSPSSFTLGKKNRLVMLKISSSHAAGPSVETAAMTISPTGSTGYGVTTMPISLQAPLTSSVAKSNFTASDPEVFGFSIDAVGPQPVSFYAVSMPVEVYRPFSLEYIKKKFEANNRTDGKYFIDYGMAQGVDISGVRVNTNELRSKATYKTLFFLEGLDGAKSTLNLTFTTLDSPGGYGYVNLTFATPIEDDTKPNLICFLGQIFGYPLQK
jgi:hypothetical protein